MAQFLEVYVAKHCFGYGEAVRLASEIRQSLPGLQVKMTLVDDFVKGNLPDIPATPSYFLDGHLLFLGNPPLEELVSRLRLALSAKSKGDNYE